MYEKTIKYFEADAYALNATGISIEEIGDGRAVCSLMPGEKHVNADGAVQGGAIYTLADFCFAVAANAGPIESAGSPDTVTLAADISYLRPAKPGERLFAEATRIKDGRRASFYEVKVFAGSGRERIIAACVINGVKKQQDSRRAAGPVKDLQNGERYGD